MRKSYKEGDDHDDSEEDEDEVEQRRREYLRRHREMLLQKQRLETERRLQEQGCDKAEIQKRIEDIQSAKQKDALALHRAATHPLGSTTTKEQTALQSTRLPGIYSRIDDLNTDTLRLIAEQQSLRDMAPLNTRGKYHARYMKHPYPVAGAQLKIEKERELCIAAKKKLLLNNTLSATYHRREPQGASYTGKSKSEAMKRSLSLDSDFCTTAAYRKLDFYVDNMTGILKSEEQSVNQAHVDRQIRFIEVQYEEGLRQFWTLVHASHKREVVAWLKAHSFVDVNVPVRLVVTKKDDSSQLRVIPDKEFGMTPLMAACKCQCVDMVTELFEQGAVVHLVTANGDTALHFLWKEWLSPPLPSSTTTSTSTSLKGVAELAVRAKSTFAILTALLAHKMDINAQNDFGETALQICARFGLEDCAKLLLAHRADAFTQDRHGKNAVTYAKENSHDNLFRILLNHGVIERTRARESERKECEALLKQGRGALTANWSQSPEKLFARLLVEDQRAGHLRSQYVDREGHVLVCDDDDDD